VLGAPLEPILAYLTAGVAGPDQVVHQGPDRRTGPGSRPLRVEDVLNLAPGRLEAMPSLVGISWPQKNRAFPNYRLGCWVAD
jgi:hypothetical protein